VVIDVLDHLVDIGLKLLDLIVVVADPATRRFYDFHHLLLPIPIVIHCESERVIHCVACFEGIVHLLSLDLQILNFSFSWRDVMFKILNLVLEDKLKLFKFLSLLLKIVDYFFAFPDLGVLFHNLLLLLIDLVLETFNRVLLLQQMKFFVLNLAFKLLNLSLNLCELILRYLQVSFCFQTHVHDLSQIARIFLFNFLVFRVGILVYLLHHLCVVFLHLLDFLLELLDQQFLLVNKVIVVLHVDIASGGMLLLNLLLGIFKGSPIRHLLLLQVRVQSRITQHLLIVFGLARFQLLVLLLQQQFKLLFVALL